jgi:hypothetical protein
MKRDMDMIRELLLDAEAHDVNLPPLDTSDPTMAYHVSLLKDAGFMDAIINNGIYGTPSDAIILGLKWNGHDFLDAARNDTIWKKAKDEFMKPGISWTFSILLEWLKQEARQRFFPTPPIN